MKIYSYSKSILGVIFTTALLIAVAHAQTSSVTTGSELESTGTITEYTPGSALVLDIGTGEPVQFKLSQNVVYADPDGTESKVSVLTFCTNSRAKLVSLSLDCCRLSGLSDFRLFAGKKTRHFGTIASCDCVWQHRSYTDLTDDHSTVLRTSFTGMETHHERIRAATQYRDKPCNLG